MDTLTLDTFLVIISTLEPLNLRSLYRSRRSLKDFLNHKRTLQYLASKFSILVAAQTFEEFCHCYTNKYEPLRSKLAWTELKRIIITTQDGQAFQIHYRAYTQVDSRKHWFPECSTLFVEELKDVDECLYAICTEGLGPADIHQSTISYATIMHDSLIADTCIVEMMDASTNAMDGYDNWEDYMIDICREYCKGVLVKGDTNVVERLKNFVNETQGGDSPEDEFVKMFIRDHLPQSLPSTSPPSSRGS